VPQFEGSGLLAGKSVKAHSPAIIVTYFSGDELPPSDRVDCAHPVLWSDAFTQLGLEI
jgi:hypothetical protein